MIVLFFFGFFQSSEVENLSSCIIILGEEIAKMIRKSDLLQNRLLAELLEQKLKPGDPIPSRHQLCRRFGCSRTTVERAIRKLVESGYLCARQGAGTFVSNPHPAGGIHTLYIIVDWERGPNLTDALREMLFPNIKPEIAIVGISSSELPAWFSKICLPGNAVLWVMPSMSSIHIMDYFADNRVPQLLVNRKYKDYNYVVTDSRNSIREGLSWLMIEAGREITLIAQEADTMHPYQYDRILAFFQCAVELGARLSPDSIFIQNFKDIPQEVAEISSRIFINPHPAKAIFILGSRLPVPFITAARSNHMTAGRDFHLLAFDYEENLRRYPGVCMMRQRFDLIYHEALRWLREGYAADGRPFHSSVRTELVYDQENE